MELPAEIQTTSAVDALCRDLEQAQRDVADATAQRAALERGDLAAVPHETEVEAFGALSLRIRRGEARIAALEAQRIAAQRADALADFSAVSQQAAASFRALRALDKKIAALHQQLVEARQNRSALYDEVASTLSLRTANARDRCRKLGVKPDAMDAVDARDAVEGYTA